MESRIIVDEKLKFQINFGKIYKTDITWGDLMKVQGVLPTDKLLHIEFDEKMESGFGSMSCEDDRKTIYTPMLTVIRSRIENDEEYFSRMREQAERNKQNEIREKNEYLRLKAKYEK